MSSPEFANLFDPPDATSAPRPAIPRRHDVLDLNCRHAAPALRPLRGGDEIFRREGDSALRPCAKVRESEEAHLSLP